MVSRFHRNALCGLILAAVSLLVLASCGGGGGDGGDPKPRPPPPNSAPSSQAGADQLVNEATAVSLDGSGSSDSDGSISAFAWAQTGGPTVQLQNPDTSVATFDAPAVTARELLTFELTVTDDDNAQSTDAVEVTINADPTAMAGDDQSVEARTHVDVSAMGSLDADGSIVTYMWAHISGPTISFADATSPTQSFLAPSSAQGITVTLAVDVMDDNGAFASDSLDIVVAPDSTAESPIGELVNVDDPPPLDFSDFDGLPQNTVGQPILLDISGVQLIVDSTTPKGPEYALSQCDRWIDACISPDHDIDDCARSAPRCKTDTPWLESRPCCPAQCFASYESRRLTQIGESPVESFITVYFSGSTCFPGM